MDMEGTTPILILAALIIGFFLIVGVTVALTTQAPTIEATPQATIATPTIQTTPTPSKVPVISNLTATNATTNTTTINDTTFNILQDYANQVIESHEKNKTWTLGDAGPRINYTVAPDKPTLKIEFLHDDMRPYDIYKEPIYLNKTLTGYVRISNTGTVAYQGDLDIYANASFFYNNNFIHMENRIDRVFVSLYPGQSNDFYKRWNVDQYNGAPIYTGAYEVIIELRDPRDGRTLYSLRITPVVAKWDELGGYV